MFIIGCWFGYFMGLNFNSLTNDKVKCLKKSKNIHKRINILKERLNN